MISLFNELYYEMYTLKPLSVNEYECKVSSTLQRAKKIHILQKTLSITMIKRYG